MGNHPAPWTHPLPMSGAGDDRPIPLDAPGYWLAYKDDPTEDTYSVCWHNHRTPRAAAKCWAGDGRVVPRHDHRIVYRPT